MDFQPLKTALPLFSHHASDALTLGGVRYTTPVSVFPDAAPQSAAHFMSFDEWIVHMAPPLCNAQAEVMLVGTGVQLRFPSERLRQQLFGMGLLNVEWMDTPAACRTYNVLCAEDRRVAGLFWIEPGAQT